MKQYFIKDTCLDKIELSITSLFDDIDDDESNKAILRLKESEITVDPITIHLHDFSSSRGFAMAMFKAAELYRDSDDIIVRYSKPIDKDNGNVYPQFQVMKSKAKVFWKHMLSTDDSFSFVLDSASDIKSCVKFFNSLGVKGEDGESLSSKETDYSKDMRDAFIKGENKILVLIFVDFDEENGDYITLEWNVMDNEFEGNSFEEVKNKVKSIIEV